MRMTTNVLILVLVAALGGCKKDASNQEGATAGQPPGQAGQAPGSPQAVADQAASDRAVADQAGKPGAGAATGEATPAKAEAEYIFSVRCVVCHGEAGRGNGPGAAALNPKPRDYSDMAWQKSVTDEDIKKVIVQGGPALGKSILMAPNPDLGQKPEVLDAMVELIRSFGQQQ